MEGLAEVGGLGLGCIRVAIIGRPKAHDLLATAPWFGVEVSSWGASSKAIFRCLE